MCRSIRNKLWLQLMNDEQDTDIAESIPDAPKNKGGRPRKKDDGTKGTWVLKNISNETKTAVKKASKANGETIGGWVDRVLIETAQEQFSASKEVEKPSDFARQQSDLLEKLADKIDNLERAASKPFLQRLFGG